MKKVLQIIVPPILVSLLLLGTLAWAPGSAKWVLPWVFPLGFILAIGVIHGFTLPEDYLKRWSKAHGIEITAENGGDIKRYLKRGRRIRAVGALSGNLGYWVWTLYIGNDEVGVNWLVATFAGYLLAAAVAEAWAFRPQVGAKRTASLAPRQISDYVPRDAIVILRLATGATILLAAAWPFMPLRSIRGFEDLPSTMGQRPNLALVLGWSGAALLIALLVELTARRIVRRPQPVTSDQLLVVDDAIRSTSMHGLLGAGLAMVLGILAGNLSRWSGEVPLKLNSAFVVLTLVFGFGAMFVWLRLGIDQPWVVRRSMPRKEVAV